MMGMDVDPEAPFESIPNEVVRMILFHLTALAKKGIGRVSRLWTFLGLSIPGIEMFDLGCVLLSAVTTNDRDGMLDSILLIEKANAEWKEKESWRRRALRVAAKKGHFRCMTTLLNISFNPYALLNTHSIPIFNDALDETQNDDRQEIENKIDKTMPVEDDLEKPTVIFKDQHVGGIWQKVYSFRALKVFIENNK